MEHNELEFEKKADAELSFFAKHQKKYLYPILKDNELKRFYYPEKKRTLFSFKKPQPKMTPETILAEVYWMRQQIENQNKQIETHTLPIIPFSAQKKAILDHLKKQHGEKRANIIAKAYNDMFFKNPAKQSKPTPEIDKIRFEVDHSQLDSKDLQTIQHAKSLKIWLAQDVLNRRMEKTKTPIQLSERIEKFNEFMQEKVSPPFVRADEPTFAGNTVLSSLEFKSWLIHQDAFQHLIQNLNDENRADPDLEKSKGWQLLNSIYEATNDTWLTTAIKEIDKTNPGEDSISENINNILKISQEYRREVEQFNRDKRAQLAPVFGCLFADENSLPEQLGFWGYINGQREEIIPFIYQSPEGDFYIYQTPSEKRKVENADEIEILQKLPFYKMGIKKSEMSDDLVKFTNKYYTPSLSIIFYLKPPEEIIKNMFDEPKNVTYKTMTEMRKKYKNCVFLYEDKLISFIENEENQMQPFPGLTDYCKLHLNKYSKLKDSSFMMSHADYKKLLTIYQTNEMPQDVLARINDAKKSTSQAVNKDYNTIFQLRRKLIDINSNSMNRNGIIQSKPKTQRENITVSKPVFKMLNKLDSALDPSKYLHLILKQVAGLALLESDSEKNTKEEKEFYKTIAQLINFDKSLKNIQDHIFKEFRLGNTFLDPPPTQGLSEMYNWTKPDMFQEWSAMDKVLSILDSAKERREQTYMVKFGRREHNVQRFYENIESYLVLNDGPTLEMVMEKINDFTFSKKQPTSDIKSESESKREHERESKRESEREREDEKNLSYLFNQKEIYQKEYLYPILKDDALKRFYFPEKKSLFSFNNPQPKMTSETLLAEVYWMRQQMENTKAESEAKLKEDILNDLKERHGEKRAKIIASTYNHMFVRDDAPSISRFEFETDPDLFDSKTLKTMNYAITLNRRLEEDVRNSRITEPNAPIQLSEKIERFNEYIQKKMWPHQEESTVAGHTILSSLAFKSWLKNQDDFKRLIQILNDESNTDANEKNLGWRLLESIYYATNDDWFQLLRDTVDNKQVKNPLFENLKSILDSLWKYRQVEADINTLKTTELKPTLGCVFGTDNFAPNFTSNQLSLGQDLTREQQTYIPFITRSEGSFFITILDNGELSQRFEVSEPEDIEILQKLSLYEGGIKKSEMSDALVQLINKYYPFPPLPDKEPRITFYLEPPEEIIRTVFKEKGEIPKKLCNQLSIRYKNCVFLYRDNIFSFIEGNQSLEPQKLLNSSEYCNEHLKNHHGSQYSKSVMMSKADYDVFHDTLVGIHKYAGSEESPPPNRMMNNVLARINDAKKNTEQVDNERYHIITKLQQKLIDSAKSLLFEPKRDHHAWRTFSVKSQKNSQKMADVYGQFNPNAIWSDQILFAEITREKATEIGSLEHFQSFFDKRIVECMEQKIPVIIKIKDPYFFKLDIFYEERLQQDWQALSEMQLQYALAIIPSAQTEPFLVPVQGKTDLCNFFYKGKDNQWHVDTEQIKIETTNPSVHRTRIEPKPESYLLQDATLSAYRILTELRPATKTTENYRLLYGTSLIPLKFTEKEVKQLPFEEKEFKPSDTVSILDTKTILTPELVDKINSCEKKLDLRGTRVSLAEYMDAKQEKITAPKPIKQMLDKLDKINDPDKYLYLILKQVAGLALLEWGNQNNTENEKAFYYTIAELIDFDESLKNIRAKINQEFRGDDAHKIKPLPAQGLRDMDNWTNPALDPKTSAFFKVLNILNSAKERREQTYMVMFGRRENKVQTFYENIENHLVLKNGASLEKVMEAINKFPFSEGQASQPQDRPWKGVIS